MSSLALEAALTGRGLKSHRPRRRKQAEQVAKPDMWFSSACQPKRARISASWLGCSVMVVSAVVIVKVCETSWRSGAILGEICVMSKSGGLERANGKSGDISIRE